MLEDRGEDRRSAPPLKGWTSRCHFVDYRTKCEDVGPAIPLQPLHLFGRHVLGRADHRLFVGDRLNGRRVEARHAGRLGRAQMCDTEIEQLYA